MNKNMSTLIMSLIFLMSFLVGCPNCEVDKSESTKAKLTKIEITTQPTKKEYHIDDTLDLTGMVVTASYSDGSSKKLASTEYTVTGFDSRTLVENKIITVTYKDKTVTFTISVVFNWYETPKQLPSDTGGTYGTEGTYVLFGVWPQDVVPVTDVATLGLETSTDKVTRGYMEYVKGSDGNYYVKCAENANVSGYKYEKDKSDVGESGTTSRWFKVMPIKWRVADPAYDVDGSTGSKTAKLLVAENILTANVPYYEDYENDREIEGKTVYPNNYMHSQIRAYLNGLSYQGTSAEQTKWNTKGFLQTAFGTTAIEAIINTVVDNSADSTTNYDTENGSIPKATDYACAATIDKIFLLSEYEVTKYSKEAYNSYGTGNSRIRVTTDFAKANNASKSTTNGYGCCWWLRSPYCLDSYYACSVNDVGDASFSLYVHDTSFGVVPALAISF